MYGIDLNARSRGGATRRARWRPVALAALTLLTLGSGCVPRCPGDVVFNFDNRTNVALCYYLSPEDAAAGHCWSEIEPRAKTKWAPDCDGLRSRPITAIIAVEEGGREIYRGTATCGKWHDTDRTFIIERVGDDFIVSDPFERHPGD